MNMINGFKLVLFDLDGTLLDTSQGIFNSVRYAEAKMGFAPIADCQLRQFVGPPPVEMYQKIYGITKESALEAAGYHREYGRNKAIYEAKVYSGIEQSLKALNQKGKQLGVVTLKAEKIARTILQYYKIADYFCTIRGMDNDESLTKVDLIEAVRNSLGVDKQHTVLVGDSIYDYEGALRADISFIPVLYGFGFSEETEFEEGKIADIIHYPLEISRIR